MEATSALNVSYAVTGGQGDGVGGVQNAIRRIQADLSKDIYKVMPYEVSMSIKIQDQLRGAVTSRSIEDMYNTGIRLDYDKYMDINTYKGQSAYGTTDLYNTIQGMNAMMNNNSIQILGENDSFETHQYTFGGIADTYDRFMMDVAGAAETPVTKLFGRSPAGMNATGESDMQNYYDTIEEKQESILRPIYDKLLPIMAMSALGAVPDDLDFEFNAVRRPDEDEMSDLASKNTDSVTKAFQAGLISQRTALKELRSQSGITGMWTNITDEDIEKADDTIKDPNEGMGDMGSLFGGGGGPETTGGWPGEEKELGDDKLVESEKKPPQKGNVEAMKGGSPETKRTTDAFNEADHPRGGNPKNPGRFSKSSGSEESAKNAKSGNNSTKIDKKTYQHYNNQLKGTVTSDGVRVKKASWHSVERLVDRRISPKYVINVLTSEKTTIGPGNNDHTRTYDYDNKRIVVDVMTGKIVSIMRRRM